MRGKAVALTFALSMGAAAAFGQESLPDDNELLEEIVVTGSRIARDEFTSPSPIQVLDVDAQRQLGVTSIADLVQRATVTNGTQIDATLATNALTANATEAPPPGGVGSSNISLRGLEPERTLILVNGRRMGSSGVRGAPSQPDISLIPFALVERVEVLTEGVSAVYGADAVAGVVNVILREGFDGVEVMATGDLPSDEGGETGQLSMIAGITGNRGEIQFAAEYFDRQRVVTGDRDWASCLRAIEQIEDGPVESVCRSGFPDSILVSPFGPLFFTEGQSDIGITNWSTVDALPPPDHPAVSDPMNAGRFAYIDLYNDQNERRLADLVGEQTRLSAVTTGRVALDWWANEELYFESMYLNSRVFSKATGEQFFPAVPGQIPQEDANGNLIVDASGAPVLVDNPMNPLPADIVAVFTTDSVPQHRDVEREQSRVLIGMRGDLGDSTWSWDGFASYDRGIGFQAQPILFEPHLQRSINTVRFDAAGNVICGLGDPGSSIGFGFVTAEPCVPLDFSRPELYIGGPNGDGAFSEAEYEYLVGNRTNRTVVEQTMINAYATGSLFTFGDDRSVMAAIGGEYRVDEINSQNDITGVQGLNTAENPLPEGSTIGERDILEIFGEINVPLHDTLQVDAALRFTDEENFGSETTWRGRLAWSPVDYFTLSGSVGTSFRAPNLREQFLAGQGGGVSGSLDPCGNFQVNQYITGIGDDSDPRAVNLTNNCLLAGVSVIDTDGNGFLDTAQLGTGQTIVTTASGSALLLPETSDSYTATVQFSQPWTDRFDLDLAVSYWDMEINNTVEEQDVGEILRDCYRNIDLPNLSSPSCALHSRIIGAGGAVQQVGYVDISFINVGERTARGIDINARFGYTFDNIGMDLQWSVAATQQLEQIRQVTATSDRDDNVGEIGTPEWRLTSTLSLLRGDWEFLMQNRYIGRGIQDDLQEYRAGIFAPALSRPVAWVDPAWYTDASLTYAGNRWIISAGVSNLFDEQPPLISFGTGPNRNNAVTSSGYDLIGRSLFVSAKLNF
jgi:iron complex outermembrane receptor protein